MTKYITVINEVEFADHDGGTIYEGILCTDCLWAKLIHYPGNDPYVNVTHETTCSECGAEKGQVYEDA